MTAANQSSAPKPKEVRLVQMMKQRRNKHLDLYFPAVRSSHSTDVGICLKVLILLALYSISIQSHFKDLEQFWWKILNTNDLHGKQLDFKSYLKLN